MRHVIINKDNKVVNIILWDGGEWLPPREHTVVRSDTAEINDIYNPKGKNFSKPPQ